MTSTVAKLKELGLAHPPKFLADNTHYETLMGSHAYGVATETSDYDVYGFCIPPLDDIFPHLRGEIPGFGKQKNRFEQYQEQHMDWGGKEFDVSIYNIVKYFQLVMDCNPNMVDSLFTPQNCVQHITQVGQMVRDSRRLFLSKKVYHTFRGYAFSQLSKITNRERTEGKRKELIEKYGYDIKFAYHVVRLLMEAEQILIEGDMDIQQGRDVLAAIRRGEWTEADVRFFFTTAERRLEELYGSSTLRHRPDEEAIKNLLLSCLEHHYGSLSHAITVPGRERAALEEIQNIIYRTLGA